MTPQGLNVEHLLPPEQAERIDRLIEGIERIAQAVNRFNDLLREAGYPTPPISIRHKGREMSLYSGEISVSNDLMRLRLLDRIDRLRLRHWDARKAAA